MAFVAAAVAEWATTTTVITAAGVTVTAGSAYAYGAVYAATFLAEVGALAVVNRAVAPKISAPSLRAQATQVNVRDPAAPRQIIWGQRRVSGVLYPVGTSGTNNEYLHLILLLADHECEELGDVTFNDEVVPLDGSGNATGRYAGFVRVKKHLGTYNQTVDTDLQTDLGSGYLTNACKNGGVAYLYIRLKMNATLFPSGVPEFYCLVKGRKVYNPGDGSQDATDPTTWKWTQNAALVVYDWVRGVPKPNGAGALISVYGVGAAASEVDETVLADSVANCDESVVLADSSTEPRYASNGTLLSSVKAGDGLDILKSAMAGDCVFSGGKWLILSGYYRTPTISALGDSDLRAPLAGVRLKPALADLCNVVRGTYVSADNAWQPADLPQNANSTYKTEDGDEEFPMDVEFQMTTSSATGQRLEKIILERSRQGISFVARCKLGAWRVRPGDVIPWTDSDFGWSSKPFEVLGVALAVENDANGMPYIGVDLTLKETASGVWDWADGEETTVDLAPNTSLRSPFDVAAPTGLGLTVTSFRQSDGNLFPQLKVAWTAPADAYVTTSGLIRIQFKKHADSDWIEWGTVKGDQVFDFITVVLLIGTAYDVQIRSENQLDQPSAWVQSLNFTVTADSTAPGAISDLAATVGTGKLVALSWSAISLGSVPDFSGKYNVYRGAHGGSRSKIAEVFSNRFEDILVTLGTSYDWDVRGVDQSGNEAVASNVVNAIPTAVGSGSVDATAPTDPTAATQTGNGTYLSGDGNVLAYEQFTIPALPAGAVGQYLLYKVHTDSTWIIAGDYNNTGSLTGVRVPDLTPGTSYDFATQAYSFSGTSSNVVTATSSPFTAPNKTTGPGAPTSVIYVPGSSSSYGRPPPMLGASSLALCSRINWTPPTDRDLNKYEVAFTTTDSDAAADTAAAGALTQFTNQAEFIYVTGTAIPLYFRVRALDNTGNHSNWAGGTTNLNSVIGAAAGNMIAQNANGVAVTGGNVSGVKHAPAAGTSAATINVMHPISVVKTLAGGAVYEDVAIDITGCGFSAKPDVGHVEIAGYGTSGDDGLYFARYNYDNGSNNSTTAYVKFGRYDGAVLAAHTFRLSVTFFKT